MLQEACAGGDQQGAPAFFAALRSNISATRQAGGAAAVLETGVACLLRFLQINLCG